MKRFAVTFLLVLIGSTCVAGCGGKGDAQDPSTSSLDDLRRNAEASERGRQKAFWLLAELLEPGGDAEKAMRARKSLDATGEHGMYEDFARGLDDSVHGRLASAPKYYLSAAKAARLSKDPNAPLIAQFALQQGIAMESNASGLWDTWGKWVTDSIEQPKSLGWRARDELVDWWADQAWEAATKDIEKQISKRLGCLSRIRLAGPFGSGATADALASHAAEEPGPWPRRWPEDPLHGQTPRMLEVEQKGCNAVVDEAVQDGVFYAEAHFDLERSEQLIATVNNALTIWVDGKRVMDRDLREWGSWTRTGVGLQLSAGRHRIMAKLTGATTTIRLMHRDGRPLGANPAKGRRLTPLSAVEGSFEANELRRFVHAKGVKAPSSTMLRYVAAYLAHVDGESEAATLLLEPLVEDTDTATGVALSMAANFVENDPIYEANQTEDLMRELHAKALERDPNLWASELNGVAQVAKSRGLVDAVKELKSLTKRYDQVPALLGALASVYGELGWTPEYRATVKARAERFPDDVDGLFDAARVLEEEGNDDKALALYERVRELDPDNEVFITRALERREYDDAIAELKRLQRRRPKRKDIPRRIKELKRDAGEAVDYVKLLEEAVKDKPKSGKQRLKLADAKFAAGDREALSNALVEAIEAGAETGPLKSALDLVQGVTELEPYRLDGQRVVAEYEHSGRQLQGTAARVLDYMAVWVLGDGSSRILEHEIIRIQSEEAINRFAEHQVRGELVLKMRVLKQDGRILEPEPVAGKPTVTFPHLEIGDYIETEQIFGSGGSLHGIMFDGPSWFFREQNVAYARSEFVVIAPKDKKMDVEIRGTVPAPTVEQSGPFTVTRWRVDDSPAAPEEPHSVPAREYLPSVSLSWGITLERRLASLADRVADTTPVDPRIVRVARKIVADVAQARELDKARALYRWVLDNVQDGEESDGRRVIIGKRGNRWYGFSALCRALNIPVVWALAKNSLAAPPKGPASEAQLYQSTVLRVGGGPYAWVTLSDKYSPFGYVPVEVRGMPAYLLSDGKRGPVEIPNTGELDRVEFRGEIELAKDGSADMQLQQGFGGKFGAGVREVLSELGERQTKDAIEGKILGANFRGARLVKHEFENLEQLDLPLTLRMEAQMARFALLQGRTLRFTPPYTPELTQYSTLPTRQTAVLLSNDRNWSIDIRIKLPSGAKVALPDPAKLEFDGHSVAINDRVENGVLVLAREVQVSAGRISPDDYPRFADFTRKADAALTRSVQIEL